MTVLLKRFSLWVLVPLLTIAAGLYWLLASESGAKWLASRLPDTVNYQSLQGTLSSGLTIKGLTIRSGKTQIAISHINGEWNLWTLLGGQLTIDNIQARGIDVQLPATQTEKTRTWQGWPTLRLPVPVNIASFNVSDMEIHQPDSIQKVEQLSAGILINPLQIHLAHFRVKLPEGEAQLTGRVGVSFPYTMDLDARWHFDTGETVYQGEGDLTGSLRDLNIEHRLIQPGTVNTRGSLVIAESFRQQGIEIGNIRFDLRNQWREFPLEKAQLSTTGSLTVTGATTQYALNGSTQLISTDDREASTPKDNAGLDALKNNAAFTLTAEGNLDGMTIEELTANTETGTAMLSGNVSWHNGIQWHASIAADNIDTSTLFPDWPATLSASASSEGEWRNGAFSALLEITKLDGTMHSYPLSANGVLKVQRDTNTFNVNAQALEVRLGKNSLSVAGTLGKNSDLTWHLNAPELSALGDNFSGKLESNGSLRGTVKKPVIRGQLSGVYLRVPGLTADSLDLTLQPDDDKNYRLTANAAAISAKTVRGDLVINASGNLQNHSVKATFNSSAYQLAMNVEGSYQNPAWTGTIKKLQIESSLADNWILENPAQVHYRPGDIAVAPFCLQGENSEACGDFKLQGSAITASAQIAKVPLEHLSQLLPASTNITGTANGHMTLSGTLDRPVGEFNLTTRNGTLSYPLPEEKSLTTPFSFEAQGTVDQSQLQSALVFALEENGSLDGNLSIALDKPHTLKGNLNGHFNSISWVQTFTDAVKAPKGELSTALTVGGSLSIPEISGELVLHNIAATLPITGVTYSDGNGTLSLAPDQSWTFSASIATGNENRLTLNGQGSAVFSENRSATLTTGGENLLVVDRSDLKLKATPELIGTLQNGKIDIDGSLAIPEATLIMPERPKNITEVSPDAVVYPRTEKPPDPLAITTDITLNLGDAVHLEGYGLSTDINGRLRIQKKASSQLRARGTLSLKNGVYQAYGQKLNVDRGLLLFQGPLNNPGLDIVAQRETPTATVGIEIGGTAQNIQSRIFSNPSLPSTQALTILITGKPLREINESDANQVANAATALGISQSAWITNELKGALGLDVLTLKGGDTYADSSLVVGEYLSPRLFISYIQSLFSPQGSFVLEYEISDRLGLKAESGETQSIDLLFQIEH